MGNFNRFGRAILLPRAIVAKANAPKTGSYKGMDVVAVERLAEAIEAA